MIEQIIISLFTIPCRLKKIKCHDFLLKKWHHAMPNKKLCSPKTDYETNNHLPCPTKKYVVRKQTTKQIITCRAQQKNM